LCGISPRFVSANVRVRFLTCLFPNLRLFSVISSGVYNRGLFCHASQRGLVLSAGSTGAVWLYSQANSYRLGPFDLVRVVPA